MRKVLSLAVICLAVSASIVTTYAASNPKATGDATWTNTSANGAQANITFNAIATTPGGNSAKGSLIYTDPNVTYTMDVQFIQVLGNRAWFAGQVTSVTGAFGGCCQVGHWVIYEVVDVQEPGVNNDLVYGEDLTQSGRVTDPTDPQVVRNLVTSGAYTPLSGAITISGGNIQVH